MKRQQFLKKFGRSIQGDSNSCWPSESRIKPQCFVYHALFWILEVCGLGREFGSRGSQLSNDQKGVTILSEGVFIVKIVKEIEQHVSLTADTETQRSQKTLAVFVFSVGAMITALDATNNFVAGFVELSTIYYVTAAVLAIAALGIHHRPLSRRCDRRVKIPV